MNLAYPSPTPQPSPEEPSTLVIPPTPLTFTPDGLEPPWQLWTTQLGYPPYTIDLGEGPITLPYVRFGTHLGVPWQLGKQAPDGEVYARRVYSAPCHRPYLPQYPGVADEDIGLFLKDAAFNFALNQSIEYTDDPGLVADVALYRHLASEVPHWKARAAQLNCFGEAYHKMQKDFQEGYGLYSRELKEVEQRLIAARARTRVHAAMVQLISQKQLGGRHYWMGMPGLDSHPCPEVLPEPPRFVMTRDLESQVYVPVPAPPPSHLPCATDAPLPLSPSTSHASAISHLTTSTPEDRRTSGKRPRNKCPYCNKGGHFGRECKTPHIFCAERGYCKVRAKSNCEYPRAHGRASRMKHRKAKKQQPQEGSSGYVAGADEQELAFDAGSTLYDMDWSN
jgi:hypothetical protein